MKYSVLLLYSLILSIEVTAQNCLEYGTFDGPYGAFQHSSWSGILGAEYDNLEQFQSGSCQNNVSEASPTGGTFVGLHISDQKREGIKRTFTGLTPGDEYCISFWWMSVTTICAGDSLYWGGDLKIQINEEINTFPSQDTWSLAQACFTAEDTVANIEVWASGPNAGYCLIDDIGEICCGLNASINTQLPDTVFHNPDSLLVFSPSLRDYPVDSVLWQFENGQTLGYDYSLSFWPGQEGEIELTVFSGFCTVRKRITLLFPDNEKLYLGNVFAPLSHRNNQFYIQAAANSRIKIIDFQIYDRWGGLVFSNSNARVNNPSDGWDGRVEGRLVNTGTFIYLVRYETSRGDSKIKTGEVLVVF